MNKTRIASWTTSQNAWDLLKNLTVAENDFQKTQNSHSRSYSRPLFGDACSRKSDFYEFPLHSRRSTGKNVKSVEDYSLFRVPTDAKDAKIVKKDCIYSLFLLTLFLEAAAKLVGG